MLTFFSSAILRFHTRVETHLHSLKSICVCNYAFVAVSYINSVVYPLYHFAVSPRRDMLLQYGAHMSYLPYGILRKYTRQCKFIFKRWRGSYLLYPSCFQQHNFFDLCVKMSQDVAKYENKKHRTQSGRRYY